MRYLAPLLLAFSLIASVAYAQRPEAVIVAHFKDKAGNTQTMWSNVGFESKEACQAVVDNPPEGLVASVLALAQRLAAEGKEFVDVACEAPKEPV